MKKFLTIISAVFSVLVGILNCNSVLAESNSDLFSMLFTEEDFSGIIEAVKNDRSVSDDQLLRDASYGQPYHYYYMSAVDFQHMAEENCFSIDTSGRSDWIIPTDKDIYLKVSNIGGELSVGIVDYSGEECDKETISSSIISFQKLEELIGSLCSGGEEITFLPVCFYIPDYFSWFIYFSADEEAYIVPYSSRPDFSGLKNRNLYLFCDAAEALEEAYPLSEMKSGYAGGGYEYGENNRSAEEKSYYLAAAFTVLLVLAVVLTLHLRKKKLKKAGNLT